MPQISITNLLKNFDDIVEQVAAGQAFVVTKRGKPHCRFEPVDERTLAELTAAELRKTSRS
jgi:prevent-host-death family protein